MKESDPAEFEGLITQIIEFGQIPSQVFTSPHPDRTKIFPKFKTPHPEVYTYISSIQIPIFFIRMRISQALKNSN